MDASSMKNICKLEGSLDDIRSSQYCSAILLKTDLHSPIDAQNKTPTVA